MPDLGLPDLATLDSRALGSRILVVRGDGVPIPSDLAALPIYTWSELAAIVDGGLVCPHPRGEACQCRADLRQIHALKLRFGGTVEGRGEAPAPPPQTMPAAAPTGCQRCGGVLRNGRCGWCG